MDAKGNSQDEDEAARALAEDSRKTFRGAPVDGVRGECRLKRPCNARRSHPLRAGNGGDGAYKGDRPAEDKRPEKRSSKVAEHANAVHKEKAQDLQHWASFVFGGASCTIGRTFCLTFDVA
jgi:hypothetical protein